MGRLRRLVLLLPLLLLSACNQPIALPEGPLYVIAGQNTGENFPNQSLNVYDRETLALAGRVALPRSSILPGAAAWDPQGRLWVGYSGRFPDDDNLVQVYSAEGILLHEARPCIFPEGDISFAAGRAFVVCSHNGFIAEVAVFSLATLEQERSIIIDFNQDFLATSSAAQSDTLVIAGGTTGPTYEVSYNVLAIIDARTLAEPTFMRLPAHADIQQIIPYEGAFYLLNVESSQAFRKDVDVHILTLGEDGADPLLRSMSVAPAPLWGAIEDGWLYTYHNPTYNSINVSTYRLIARTNLATGEVTTWQLPDEWDASSLALVDGQVMLTLWESYGGPRDGLYRFDTKTGKLSRVIALRDASTVLPPPGT